MFFVNSVNTFSTWLLSMLGDKGWSQAELARRAGVTPTATDKTYSVLLNEEVADIISTFKPD